MNNTNPTKKTCRKGQSVQVVVVTVISDERGKKDEIVAKSDMRLL